jgi:hypothetical protein
MEAADLGVRLCQGATRSVYPCYALAAIPVVILAVASLEIAGWLPTVVIWWSKPWLDRSILFVLSRAAFGQRTTLDDLWRARRQVWLKQLPFTLTVRRLSLWRSLTQPVYQLEGLSVSGAYPRVRQIRYRAAGSALMMAHAFVMAETAIYLAVISLVFWLAPSGMAPEASRLFSGQIEGTLAHTLLGAYTVAVLVVEPYYVAAGFAMYLNRRVELEAWDIEQEFRRAFDH